MISYIRECSINMNILLYRLSNWLSNYWRCSIQI
nr:MAG TPA: hypothetical protein [Caudoviricetes sp.]